MSLVFKFILNALPWVFRIGTLLGKDPVFKYRESEAIGPWVITELSGADRQTFADLANKIIQLDEPERSQQYLNMKYQVIAATTRTKRGYFVFDPMNAKHLGKIAQYPENILMKAIETISKQSGMPWLVPSVEDESSAPVDSNNENDVDWEGDGNSVIEQSNASSALENSSVNP